MIVFVTQKIGPIQIYLRSHGAPIARRFRPMTYDRLLSGRPLPRATYCFADLERLEDDVLARSAPVHEMLVGRGDRVLNHPTRTRRRFDLLRSLHERGTNRFDVTRLADGMPARFPVFLHGEHDHAGSRSGLLEDEPALVRAVEAERALGHRVDDLLAVEFLDTAGPKGEYRKYGAFIVGDRILARHLFIGHDWEQKHAERADDAAVQEELDYVRTNPHEASLREVFGAAGVEYGRADYSVLDGTLQIWEINTNPTIAGRPRVVRPEGDRSLRARTGRGVRRVAQPLLRRVPALVDARDRIVPRGPETSPRAPVHELFAARLREAWEALDR